MNTELITQLIILATAIVGLYKAATYKPSISNTDKSRSTEPHPISNLFTGLLNFAGVFAFMLIMPAFVWAFTAISNNIDKNSSQQVVQQYSLPYKLSNSPTNLELMLIAANKIPNMTSRAEALEKITTKALKECELRLALAAATEIPNQNNKSEKLEEFIEYVSSGKCN